VSICANTNIGQLCQDLNSIVVLSVWYETFEIKNSKWLWLVNDIVANINSDKILCGSFGLYPSYAAGVLNSAEKIHFYVLCYEQLNYEDYIKNILLVKTAAFPIKRIEGVISSYRLVVKLFQYNLKQE
jgi:hypothetical protein